MAAAAASAVDRVEGLRLDPIRLGVERSSGDRGGCDEVVEKKAGDKG